MKMLVGFLWGAFVASMWWIVAVFDSPDTFWAGYAGILASLGAAVAIAAYVVKHWNDTP